MSAAAILAGQVAIEAKINQIGKAVGDLEKLTKGMTKVEEATKKAGKSFKLISFLVAFNVIQRNISKAAKFLAEFSAKVDNLAKGSQRLGLTVQQYRELSMAVELSGGSLEQFETAMSAMQRNIGNFAMGTGEAKLAFEQLGLTIDDLRGMGAEEQLKLIADELLKFSDHGDRAALAMKIFGEGGVKLMPFLNKGSAGIEDITDNVKALGGEISQNTVVQFEKLNDMMKLWKERMFATSATIIESFLPAIRSLLIAVIAVSAAMGQDFKMDEGIRDSTYELELAGKAAWVMVSAFGQLEILFISLDTLMHTLFASLKYYATYAVGSLEVIVRAWSQVFEELENFANELLRVRKELEATTKESLDEALKAPERMADASERMAVAMVRSQANVKNISAQFDLMYEAAKLAADAAKQIDAGLPTLPKVKQLSTAFANLSGAFTGGVIRAGGAAGAEAAKKLQLQQTMNQLLKDIKNNTANAAVVGGV